MTYRFRIRTAAKILNENNEILIALHKNPFTGEECLTLPGGSLEGEKSATEAVVKRSKRRMWHINCG